MIFGILYAVMISISQFSGYKFIDSRIAVGIKLNSNVSIESFVNNFVVKIEACWGKNASSSLLPPFRRNHSFSFNDSGWKLMIFSCFNNFFDSFSTVDMRSQPNNEWRRFNSFRIFDHTMDFKRSRCGSNPRSSWWTEETAKKSK